MEEVILVDSTDKALGLMEKMEAHRKGLLHRAFSVFIFNSNNELLLQQRAITKYHSGGLWTNSCCSHPRSGEEILQAGKRRLSEELGISCELKKAFDFIYKSELDNQLTEHEFDHVLFGKFDGEPVINTDEVESWKYMSIPDIQADIRTNPENYTEWFKICFEEAVSHIEQNNFVQ